MGKYFWLYTTDLPEGIGVKQFSPVHLIWASSALLIVFLAAVFYLRLSKPVRRRFEILLAVLLASGYVFRWIWAVVIGHYEAQEMFPIHLCALSAMIEFAAVISGKPFFKEFGYACGLPGALATFIMPDMGLYPLWHFYYLVFILCHSILILLPILWIWGDGFRPDLRRLLQCFVLLLFLAGCDVIINIRTGSNFMFLNYVPGTAKLKAAAEWAGNPGYQFAMVGILFTIWAFLYIPWILVNRRRRRKETRGGMTGQG